MQISENRIADMMKRFDCTREEAIETIKADAEIDKMSMKQIKESYTEEERKAIKDATKTGKKKTVYKFEKKARPKDSEKVNIVEQIAEYCKTITQDCKIANAGQEITFTVGGNNYSLVLTKHRTPKK